MLALKISSLSSKNTPAHSLPLYLITSHDNLKIGFTNGYQIVPANDPLSLLTLARELDVDILIWGGTHKVEAYTLDGKFFVNPGSATGAFNFDWPERYEEEEEVEVEVDEVDVEVVEEEGEENGEGDTKKDEKLVKETKTKIELDLDDPIPSFCLLDTHDSTCTLYIYTYLDGEVKVDKVSYTKEQPN